MKTNNTTPIATIYTVITYAVFGSIQTTVAYYAKEDAEENVVEWANTNNPEGIVFTSCDEAIDWYVDNDESVDISIRIEETYVYGGAKPKVFKTDIVFGGSPEVLGSYSFETQEELNAFYLGMEAMDGWDDYRTVENLNDDDYEYLKENNPDTYKEVCALTGMQLCVECDSLVSFSTLNVDGLCPDCQGEVKMFYIRTEKGTEIVSNEHLSELMKSDLVIGISDYSLEFNWDGSFLYPVDRDSGETFDRIYTVSEMANILLSHGSQIVDAVEFLKSLPFEIFISDGLNMHDYHIDNISNELKK